MKIVPGYSRITGVGDARAFQNFTAIAADTSTPCKEDPEVWFDPTWFPEAKARCLPCPLIRPCLEFAINQKQTAGVWGGMDEKERAGLVKALAQTKRQRRERAKRQVEKL